MLQYLVFQAIQARVSKKQVEKLQAEYKAIGAIPDEAEKEAAANAKWQEQQAKQPWLMRKLIGGRQ